MYRLLCCIMLLIVSSIGTVRASENNTLPLRILYISRDNDPSRRDSFVLLLKEHFIHSSVVNRGDFKVSQAEGMDVVILDWSQREPRSASYASPLGRLENWSIPTMLLGSAGLLIAGPWQVIGGAGCTCLRPFAYGLHGHAITEGPIRLDLTQAILTETPSEWKREIADRKIEVLPLAREGTNQLAAGWCTYTYEHIQAPELEIICGGINSKTSRASGIWRQGHLLHFGFEQSPAELNENGRALLVNAICYIAKFSEDRPIIRTPSAVYSKTRIVDRDIIARALDNLELDLSKYLSYFLAPELFAKVKDLDRAGLREWFREVRPYLRADGEGKLTIDEAARQFGTAPSEMDFFDQVIKAHFATEKQAKQARELLLQYAPAGPEAEGASGVWQRWLNENRDYVFFSDTGGYRWYLDPIAKRRGTPTRDLRGANRMTAVRPRP